MSRKQTILDVLGRETVHPFPARMAPNIALRTLSKTTATLRVLDPMMGSGTVLAVARAQGHRAVGVDLDPLASLLSKVWTSSIDKEKTRSMARRLLDRAKEHAPKIQRGDAYPERADEETRRFIRYWFDGRARRQLAALAAEIPHAQAAPVRNVLWCAFSRLIITKQAGASRAMDLSHSRPHRSFDTAPIEPFDKFLDAVERVLAGCIDSKQKNRGPATTVMEGDARSLSIKSGSIDLVLTSPPYLNAIDYVRCSKFSLIWMGYSISSLRALRRASVGAESKDPKAHNYRALLSKVQQGLKLGNRDAAILDRYVRDMSECLLEVQRVLRVGGKAIYVVGENTVRGTFIPTARIIRELARSAGLTLSHTRSRELPGNRRYLPPPATRSGEAKFDGRMRREVVMTFRKEQNASPRRDAKKARPLRSAP